MVRLLVVCDAPEVIILVWGVVLEISGVQINTLVGIGRLMSGEPWLLIVMLLHKEGRLVTVDVNEMKLDVLPPGTARSPRSRTGRRSSGGQYPKEATACEQNASAR